MKVMPIGERFIVEYDLFNYMKENERFNEYVGKCITHFVYFVLPIRDKTKEIAQDYPVPTDIEDVGGNRLLITRKDSGSIIHVGWWKYGRG